MTNRFGIGEDRGREIRGVLMLALSAMLFLALATDGYLGDRVRPLSDLTAVPNALGKPGAAVAGFLYILLGQAAHVFYVMTTVWALMLLRHKSVDRLPTRIVGLLLAAGPIAGLIHIDFANDETNRLPGGMLGAFAAHYLEPAFGIAGSNVIAITLAVVGVLLATEFLFVKLAHTLMSWLVLATKAILQFTRQYAAYMRPRRLPRELREAVSKNAAVPGGLELSRGERPAPQETPKDDLSRIRIRPDDVPEEPELPFGEVPFDSGAGVDLEEVLERETPAAVPAAAPVIVEAKPPENARKLPSKAVLRRRAKVEEALPADYEYPKRYKKPPMDLLDRPVKIELGDLTESLRQTAALLEETLETFGIEARVTDVTRGPTITRFEVEPAPGIKVSRFVALADDLALALKAHLVRVEAPIPGKGKVGIEVPNETRESVVIRELLESRAFRNAESQLALVLGKDITGEVKVADLATMPHLLVAGATGAGKTVCVKTLLASLLFSKTPEELQLMLIDPKMVELSIFNDIPHLITPVVIDPKKAAASLSWLINEMEERYRLFAHLGVRNIEVYNQSVENGEIEMEGGEQQDNESLAVIRKLPYIVCVVDELADLMMLARAEVEDAIARLAQLARAVGIHLIIATQRPSVDVLTGVIKANFPARISFQVSSRVDSRCILDEIGAEKLIGRGDMLYLPAGQVKPNRLQGAFVSDEEMNALIAYLKTQAPPQYRDEIENYGKQAGTAEDLGDEDDELLDDAIRVVLETGQASISMIQRRLRVGYTRAARLIDMMEVKGIVGPHIGSKAREILVSAARGNGEVA